MSVNDVIMDAMIENNVGFVTTVPCKQLAGVIEKLSLIHISEPTRPERIGVSVVGV